VTEGILAFTPVGRLPTIRPITEIAFLDRTESGQRANERINHRTIELMEKAVTLVAAHRNGDRDRSARRGHADEFCNRIEMASTRLRRGRRDGGLIGMSVDLVVHPDVFECRDAERCLEPTIAKREVTQIAELV